MSEKVVITKEQAEALEKFGWQGFSALNILTLKFRKLDFQVDSASSFLVIKDMDLDTLAKALCLGYQVEPTPEEIILKRYKQAKENEEDEGNMFKQYEQGTVDAIEMVLRTLKIEIEGIHK